MIFTNKTMIFSSLHLLYLLGVVASDKKTNRVVTPPAPKSQQEQYNFPSPLSLCRKGGSRQIRKRIGSSFIRPSHQTPLKHFLGKFLIFMDWFLFNIKVLEEVKNCKKVSKCLFNCRDLVIQFTLVVIF